MTHDQFVFCLKTVINIITNPDSDIKDIKRQANRLAEGSPHKYVHDQFVLQATILNIYISLVGGKNA